MYARLNSAGQRVDRRGRYTGAPRRRNAGTIIDDMVPNVGGGYVGSSSQYRNAAGQFATPPKVTVGKNYGTTTGSGARRWKNRTSKGKVVGRSAVVNSRVRPDGTVTRGAGVAGRNARARAYSNKVGSGARRASGKIFGSATPAVKAGQATTSRKMSGAGRWVKGNPGKAALFGAAIVGGAAFAAYRSGQRTARDINQSLGNPATSITSWTTYNRTTRGY